MARARNPVAARRAHKKVLAKAKGYKGARSRRFRTANEQVMHAGQDAYRDRRARKGEFRKLGITRIRRRPPERDDLLQLIVAQAADIGRPQDAGGFGNDPAAGPRRRGGSRPRPARK